MDENKLKAKLDRAVRSINEVIAEVQKEYPDAIIYISSDTAHVCKDGNTDDGRDQEETVLFQSIGFKSMDHGSW